MLAFLCYCHYCAIAKPDIGGPQFYHRAAFLLPGCNTFRYTYSIYQTQPHIWNCNNSKKAVAALPQEEFTNNRLPCEFRNFSVKPRCCPIVKHRWSVRKSSFHKLTMEMPIEVTIWTALSDFVRVCCEFFGQFQRLVRTYIWPSSIIIIRSCKGWKVHGFMVCFCHHLRYFAWWRIIKNFGNLKTRNLH